MKIGIDLGGTNVRVARVDDTGILQQIIEPCRSDRPEQEVIDHIIELIHRLMTPQIKGIGIGVPSMVDPQNGIVYNVVNIPSWKEVHLKEILEIEFKIPTYVNNDANCFTLGEKYYGAAKDYDDVVGITLGTGVGSGLIMNGELYTGSNTSAGEIGSIAYKDKTFEDYCGSLFFEQVYNTTGQKAYQEAKENNPQALKIWDEFGTHMGNLISLTLFAYDPQIIVFGGSIANAYDLFAPAMYRVLDGFMYPEVTKNIIITTSQINDVGILGAASLVK